MEPSSNAETFLFLMGSLTDAAILDEAIAAKQLDFQKLGVLTYVARLEETPDAFCDSLRSRHGLDGDVHWMRLPYPTDRPAPRSPEFEAEAAAYVPEPPKFFMVNN